MQAPRLPSIFKSPKVRRFSFPVRYYDERKERIEDLKKGKREWNESKISPEIAKIGTKFLDRTIERFQEIKYTLS